MMATIPAEINTLGAYRAAKLLVDQHGRQEAWRILTTQAIDEHLAGNVAHLEITLATQEALRAIDNAAPEDISRDTVPGLPYRVVA